MGFDKEAPPEDVLSISIPKNFTKLTGKRLCRSPTHVFSCEFCKIFENTYFCRTPPVAAS